MILTARPPWQTGLSRTRAISGGGGYGTCAGKSLGTNKQDKQINKKRRVSGLDLSPVHTAGYAAGSDVSNKTPVKMRRGGGRQNKKNTVKQPEKAARLGGRADRNSSNATPRKLQLRAASCTKTTTKNHKQIKPLMGNYTKGERSLWGDRHTNGKFNKSVSRTGGGVHTPPADGACHHGHARRGRR